jgi:hypothetical protein
MESLIVAWVYGVADRLDGKSKAPEKQHRLVEAGYDFSNIAKVLVDLKLLVPVQMPGRVNERSLTSISLCGPGCYKDMPKRRSVACPLIFHLERK